MALAVLHRINAKVAFRLFIAVAVLSGIALLWKDIGRLYEDRIAVLHNSLPRPFHPEQPVSPEEEKAGEPGQHTANADGDHAQVNPTVAPTSPSTVVATDQVPSDEAGSTQDASAVVAEPIETSSSQEPQPGWKEGDKVIVMAALTRQDTTWVAEDLPDWQRAIYTVDNQSAPLHTPANKGREAMAYLTYIIDHYDNLPPVMAFMHPHRGGYPQAWHNEGEGYRAKSMLDRLQLSFIRQKGYANLRCISSPGCPNAIVVNRDPPKEGKDGEPERNLTPAWKRFFNNTMPPEVIATPCCAQFAVSAEQVRKRPRELYVDMRTWLLETELDDYVSGRIFEYLWHIIFGQEPVYCPPMAQCECDVYGKCHG